MNKQYKLIKEYPGSPKLSSIASTFNEYNYKIEGTREALRNAYIENQPEYWQEITKPEYTILSVKYQHNNLIYNLDNYGNYSNNYGFIANKYVIKGNLTHDNQEGYNVYINSVRRESDGEVFTVGDLVDVDWDSKDKEKGKIAYINLVNSELTFGCGYARVVGLSNLIKVKPKEWEITSFRCVEYKTIWKRKEDGKFRYNCEGISYTEKEFLYPTKSMTPVEIYSVKRLSDNVEFKIGDYISISMESFPILQITQEDNTCYLFYRSKRGGLHTDKIDRAIKISKQPLFTTEDGVDIYKGDKYYWVSGLDFNIKDAFTVQGPTDAPITEVDEKYKIHNFSTQKAAENYIKCNKPILSLNDVLKTLDENGIDIDYMGKEDYNNMKNELTKLVKKKLKQ